MPENLRTVLSIAGSDPTGGAGIQADIRSGDLMGCHILTAITAVTVQNSSGVSKISPIPPDLLDAQLKAISEDVLPDAIKIGLVGSLENFYVIGDFIKSLAKPIPVVIDPILKSTAGGRTMTEGLDNITELTDMFFNRLFPLATVITPNNSEASLMAGICNSDEETLPRIRKALNVRNLVITGSKFNDNEFTDVLVDDEDELISLSHPEIECENLHGTGCVFSTLLACNLALGKSLKDAFLGTSERMYEIISKSTGYQLGDSTYGPLNINDYRL